MTDDIQVGQAAQFLLWQYDRGGPLVESKEAWEQLRAALNAPSPNTPSASEDVGRALPHTKHAEANSGCWAKALDDEPMFIILGRDPDGGNIVRLWAERRSAAGDPEHGEPVMAVADAMDAWRAAGHRPTSAPPQEAYSALHSTTQPERPIPMILHCPACRLQHIDEATSDWDNPPHRSHLCHGCGHIWRPADVATDGVAAINTFGSADSPKAQPERLDREAMAAALKGWPVDEFREWAANGTTYPNSYEGDVERAWLLADRALALFGQERGV
jgi:hypothetical protein